MKHPTIEQILYCTGLCITGILLLFFLILAITDTTLSDIFPPCMLYSHFGLYCPGCGGTRAFFAFLQGDWITSFCYHPFVPYAFLTGGWFMLSHTLYYITDYFLVKKEIARKNKIKPMRFRPIYGYLSIGFILIPCIIKNILILF